MSQNDGPLQNILQLANVSRPIIPREGVHCGCRNVVDCPAHSLGMFLNEVACEQRYVFAAVPKRWHAQRKDVEPVVQVGAKFVFVHHRFKVPIRGGYEADVGSDRSVAAHALEFLVLDGTQQLRLEFERHLPDLIKKQRALVSQLESPNLLRNRTGKRTFLMAEEFALQKALRNRGAIYFNEAAPLAWTQLVSRPGDQFFSGSGLTQNENGRIGWRNDLNAFQNGLESESLPHHVPDVVV